MKHYITALILVGGLAAAQAQAACNYPVAPGKFPDGNQATKEEMLAAKKQVVQYNTDMEAYLTCIQGEYDAKVAADATATEDQKAEMARMQDQKHNAAVQELQSVADRFNEQLRVWKAKNAAEKDKKPS
ncbi:MAG TPA: hypothetical protein VFS13_19835 [Steroidobacteraceae bacterium]|jgi:hypothetical protein|nr:hypothetical protein [Steroidobacteraceae bacterium]